MPDAATAPLSPKPALIEARAALPLQPLAWLALWLFATLGLRPLLVPDEGRYGSVARDMLASGDWIVPRLDGLPFFHKPPLMYWLDAAAMAVVGAHPYAARVAPAIGAWIMAAALYVAMHRWHGARAARVGLGVIATAPLFFLSGQYANHDMLVAGLITAAVLAFADAAMSATPRRAWQIGWACCALALLSKGLIGIVLPLMIVGPWVLAQRRWRAVAAALHPWSWLPGLVIAAPWFIAMQWRYPEFFDYFVIEQHFRRYTQASFNNGQPVWFYWLVLPLATVPWSLAAPWLAPRAWRERNVWTALYASWAVIVLVFFSLPNSKLVGYVLPALAPWCALLACHLDAPVKRWRIGLGIGTAISAAVIVALMVKTPHSTLAAGRVLAAQKVAGDTVVYVDEMVYDLAFYAGLTEPVIVASDWSDPAIPQHDNWRKELADAARFDAATARRVLWPIARLAELTCRPGARVWFVTAPGYRSAALDAVPGLVTLYSDTAVTLRRAPGRACP